MTFRKMLLVFAALALVVIGAGCGTLKIAGQPIGAQPTATNTRVVRPTFTLIPTDTDTPVPTNTATSTPTQVPATATATKRPVIVPTRPPATAVPIPPTVPPPTTQAFLYRLVGQKCEHSGGTYIDVFAFVDYPNDPVSGVGVLGSVDSPDGARLSDQPLTTGDDGKATFVLRGDGLPARVGTYYVWLVDGSKRISEFSQPIRIDGKQTDDGCWYAKVAFSQH